MSVPNHFFSMTKAAKEAGVNRSTIQRQIKAGKLSAQRDDNNHWRIDPAELHRMYPIKADNDEEGDNVAQQGKTDATQQSATPEMAELVATLRNMVETLQQQQSREVEQLNETIEDLRDRLDKESSQNRALTAMLTDQRENKEPDEPPEKKSFFSLFSA